MSELLQLPSRYTAETMGRMRRLHFIGIGGAGMNGIAQVMLNLGYEISGSDIRANAATKRLQDQGAAIMIGHDADNVANTDAVIISSAVKEDNAEVVAARAARIPVVPRAEMLAEIMRFRYGVAVAGTHGKTTTTSLVASVLIAGGLDPTYVIGGKLNAAGKHAHLGEGEVLVAEADESDASFLCLQPMMAVVTNIDADHMETYGGDFQRLQDAFVEFLHHLPFYGVAVLCIDDAHVAGLLPRISRQVRTYGLSPQADIRATNLEQQGAMSRFTVEADGIKQIDIQLNLPGTHNVLNALAAIAVGLELDVSADNIQRALTDFQGIARRFQVYPDINVGGANITLIDDYGHHPSEIEAMLNSIRNSWEGHRLVLVFQPHRYTRTRDAFEDFTRVLSGADVLILSEVYAAGESPIEHADGRTLARSIRARGQVDPVFIEQIIELPEILPGVLKDGDVLALMGAGDIGEMALALSGGAKH
ncbi:MAG: UDP-N-acetylmuramate--L-alanine ligase [bacterium]